MPDISEENWAWWAGAEYSETFQVGPCATRQEVIDQACAEEVGYSEQDGEAYCRLTVTEAINTVLQLAAWINVEEMVDRADEQVEYSNRVCYEFDEPPYFVIEPEALKDLTDRVKRAVSDWQKIHRPNFKVRTFEKMRNKQTVIIKLQADPVLDAGIVDYA